MEQSVKSVAIRFGLITGVISLINLALGYAVFEPGSMAGSYSSLAAIVITLAITVATAFRLKAIQGGYASFKQIFSTYMVSRIIQFSMLMAAMMLLYLVVDTDFAAQMAQLETDNILKQGELRNTPPKEIEVQLERAKEFNVTVAKTHLINWLVYISINTPIGLLLAAGTKKVNPQAV